MPTAPASRRPTSWLAVSLLLLAAGGCGSRFAGEWAEVGATGDGLTSAAARGPAGPVAGALAASGAAADADPRGDLQTDRRPLALQFIPPLTLRSALYNPHAGTVEPDTVQESQYTTMDGRRIAQFGAYTARVEGGILLVQDSAGNVRRLVRVRDGSVFPPNPPFPALTRGGKPVDPAERTYGDTAFGGSDDRGLEGFLAEGAVRRGPDRADRWQYVRRD